MHASNRSLEATLLLCLSLLFALLPQAASGASASLVAGWNLLGNSSNAALNVAGTFGASTPVTTVWKWVSSKGSWAFYAPSMTDAQLRDYAGSKGYDVLTTINAGEGFWVNAKTSFTAPLPAGAAVTSASFRTTLLAGWNLISSGDNKTPSQFNQALDIAPPPLGTTPLNLITLWSWDATRASWYFYAPSLEASGGTALSDYASGKGYLNYGTKSLDPATGYWVNRSAPPASIALASASASSALPMSVLTLSGTGFDTTAMTSVRFFDADQYAVDVRPIRVASTSISVAVPPYFNTTAAMFAPGAVSIKVIQSTAAGTRSSAALAGFQILDLPIAAGPAGAVTLDFLQSLQANATALQSSAGAALGAALGSALASQASALALLANTVQLAVTNPLMRISLGTYKGVSMDMGASELRQTDRLLLGTVLALNEGSSSLAATSTTAIAGAPFHRPATPDFILDSATRQVEPLQLAFNGALDPLTIQALLNRVLASSALVDSDAAFGSGLLQLAQTSAAGGCMQPEAGAYALCVQRGEDASVCSSRTLLGAPAQSTLCATPGAIGTSLAVVGAGLAAGVAILALGFGTTAVAGTAGVLALVGYLAYATVATGMVQIGIGGALGQTSAAGRQMVEGGVKQLNDFVRDTTISLGVNAVAGEVAGIVNDVVTAAINLGDALEQTALPTTTTTSTSSTSTSTATPTTSTTITTSTTTTLPTAYCSCTFDVYSKVYGPGGAWFCRNTNIWDSSTGALMSEGACRCDPGLYQVCQ